MLLYAVPALETFDPPCRIDQTLLASEKRMALRAHFDVQFRPGRTGLEGVAARAGNHAAAILRMDPRFHLLIPAQATWSIL